MIRQLDECRLNYITEALFQRDIYFFSSRETANLKGIRELFRDPEKFQLEYYHPIKTKDSYKYVFPEKQPSYHKDSSCERLRANYRNFEVPVQIREKGEQSVRDFRTWFAQAGCEKLAAKDYIYAIQKKYPEVGEINPRSIDHTNTGTNEIENLSLPELEGKIFDILAKCDQYFTDNINIRNIISRYQKWTFLAFTYGPIKNNFSGLPDEQLRDFLLKYELTFKTPVKDLLIQYYRVKFNPDLTFEGWLLERLGFRKCSICLEEKT